MPGDILVLVEHSAGKIDSLSFQLLAIGQRLAAEMKVDLLAAAIGHRMENVVEALQGHGTDKILVVDDPALPLASAEVQAHVFAQVARQIAPRLVLIGYSLVGMELTPAIANKLGMNALTNCVNIELRDGAVTVTRPLFDGTMHAHIALDETATAVVALQKGSVPAIVPSAKQAVVQWITIDVNSVPSRSRVLEITEEPKGGCRSRQGRDYRRRRSRDRRPRKNPFHGGTCRGSRWDSSLLPASGRRWVATPGAASGRFREECSTESLHCLRHLRRHSAFDRYARIQADYRHQQRRECTDLSGGSYRRGRRSF